MRASKDVDIGLDKEATGKEVCRVGDNFSVFS